MEQLQPLGLELPTFRITRTSYFFIKRESDLPPTKTQPGTKATPDQTENPGASTAGNTQARSEPSQTNPKPTPSVRPSVVSDMPERA